MCEGHTEQKVWTDLNVASTNQAFLEGLSAGLSVPSDKDKRLIILNIGSDLGFVDGGLLYMESIKTGTHRF